MSGSGFDLETALAAWRNSLEYSSAMSNDDLEELERHLRDEIAALTANGLSIKDAFDRAVRDMGDYASAESEYRKVYWGKRRSRGELLQALEQQGALLKNYLKTAWRTFWDRKTYAILNITGLTVALTSALLILLYVADEYSYDRFHEKSDRIVRVANITELNGEPFSDYVVPPRAAALFPEIPEVESVARFMKAREPVIRSGAALLQSETIYATENFFEVFTHEFLAGDPTTALNEPYSVVLTDSFATLYFGDEPALGKTLTFFQDDYVYSFDDQAFTVTGVIENVRKTSFNFDVVLPLEANPRYAPEDVGAATFLLLHENAPLEGVRRKTANLVVQHFGSDEASGGPAAAILQPRRLRLQPITDVHLDPPLDREWIPGGGGGDMRSLIILMAVGVFLILIACVNYVNMSTARASRRAREIGIRKVTGASRAQLVAQHLGEAVGVTLIAFALAALVALCLIPSLNHITGKVIGADQLIQPPVMAMLIIGAVFIGLSAGTYPALFLTRFAPIDMLKNATGKAMHGHRFRGVLVVTQFTLSVAMIAFAVIVHQQVDYIQNKDLGFDKESILIVDHADKLGPRQVSFLEEVKRQSQVVEAGFAQTFPGRLWAIATVPFYKTAGEVPLNSDPAPNPGQNMHIYFGDHGLLPALGIDLIAGRNFFVANSIDSAAILVNRAAVKAMGWDNPLEETLYEQSFESIQNENGSWRREPIVKEHHVIGVVEDFHHYPVQQQIEPMVIMPGSTGLATAIIRVAPGEAEGLIASIEDLWVEMQPDYPFEHYFLDDQFEATYRREVHFGTLAGFFTALSIVIACLGMVGLAAFTAERRTKEVGIRKALGATVQDVLVLLCRDTVKWVVIACIIGLPVAYFAIVRWLDRFAYRVDIDVLVFVLAGASAILLAVFSVCTQALSAATANPAHALRDE